MSENDTHLREFTVRLNFTRAGEVESVSYACLEEYDCGSHPFDLGGYVDDLASAHLIHMRDVHKISPIRQCGYTLSASVGRIPCTRGPHGTDVKHQFEF